MPDRQRMRSATHTAGPAGETEEESGGSVYSSCQGDLFLTAESGCEDRRWRLADAARATLQAPVGRIRPTGLAFATCALEVPPFSWPPLFPVLPYFPLLTAYLFGNLHMMAANTAPLRHSLNTVL